jgi:metal-responsive CopG/Arc/MetJ family transcriptional regulator
MSTPKDVRFGMLLEERQLVGIQQLSEQTGASLSEIVRRAINEYLLRQQKKETEPTSR